jgi:4-diphosphocytidyl-2-C-methyl-D-erythritol kinase
MTEIAYAKINLALHVRRRRDDGYHEIETIFAFAADGDAIMADFARPPGLDLRGPFAGALAGEADDDNLVLRAARLVVERAGRGHVPAITLDKRLPVAAGIGGGSADAAAVLRLMAAEIGLAGDDPLLLEVAASLGADVPACVASVPVRGDGRGDALRAIEASGLKDMPLLLVNPRVSLATGPVFKAWDSVDRGALGDGDPLAVAIAGRNDLEPPARSLCPAIGEVVGLLDRQPGVRLARMSGSGATCFALFDRLADRDVASAAIASARPDWWQLATVLR